MAAILLIACFALRSSSDDSSARNWVDPQANEMVVETASDEDLDELRAATDAIVELPQFAGAQAEVETDSVAFAYTQTEVGSFVELASKQSGGSQSPESIQAAAEAKATEWTSTVATNAPSNTPPNAPAEFGSPFAPAPEESVFVPPESNGLYDLDVKNTSPIVDVTEVESIEPAMIGMRNESVTSILSLPDNETTFTGQELVADDSMIAEENQNAAPTRPAFPESLPQIWTEPRVAALPQDKEKPKFKKFGAKAKDKNDKDDDEDDDGPPEKQPVVLSSSTKWKLAAAPGKGDRYKDDTPLTDDCSHFIEGVEGNFSPTPTMPEVPYDPLAQMNVYQGKKLYANQRPLLELGRPWYQLGPISEGSSILGFHNHVNPQYVLFGDARTGFASNNVGGDGNTLIASQLNFFHHFKFTSTERFVAGHTPLSRGANNTRYNFDDSEFEFEGNANFNFAYIEGDVGAITGGAIGQTLPFDLPFAAGIIPLVFQNGIWMEDEILGFAVTLPARNSARLDISNMDITFFAGYDRLNSPVFVGDDSAARVMGIATFLDAMNGHFEIDYAFLDDRTNENRSYHNIGIGFTRRYGRFLSNSTRVIVNAGQQNGVPGTADGVLLLSENSLITGFPSTVVPYLNMFAGFDRPQSVGRNGAAGGILRNTGILFESDNLTGYPTLDATANDTFGMSLGLNLLADEFAQQLIVEASMLGVMGDGVGRNALGDQYGLGMRYQLPLTNSVLVRADAMVGFLRDDEDIRGARLELRKKF